MELKRVIACERISGNLKKQQMKELQRIEMGNSLRRDNRQNRPDITTDKFLKA